MSRAIKISYTVTRVAPLAWRWLVLHSDAPAETGFALTPGMAKAIARGRIRRAQGEWKKPAKAFRKASAGLMN